VLELVAQRLGSQKLQAKRTVVVGQNLSDGREALDVKAPVFTKRALVRAGRDPGKRPSAPHRARGAGESGQLLQTAPPVLLGTAPVQGQAETRRPQPGVGKTRPNRVGVFAAALDPVGDLARVELHAAKAADRGGGDSLFQTGRPNADRAGAKRRKHLVSCFSLPKDDWSEAIFAAPCHGSLPAHKKKASGARTDAFFLWLSQEPRASATARSTSFLSILPVH
jgi:hypothetical protein